MTLVAICGVPGSGKSTIAVEFKALGLDVVDADVDGMAEWRHIATKEPAPDPVDWHDPVATAHIEYTVSRSRIKALRARAASESHPVYLCGLCGLEDEYWDLLDVPIQLNVDNETLRHRLLTRTTNSFGKAEHEREGVLAANPGWSESYRRRGAAVIDATGPLEKVLDQVVATAEAAHRRGVKSGALDSGLNDHTTAAFDR